MNNPNNKSLKNLLKAKKPHLQFQKEVRFLHKANHLEKIHLQLISNPEPLIWEVLDKSLRNLIKINLQNKFQIN